MSTSQPHPGSLPTAQPLPEPASEPASGPAAGGAAAAVTGSGWPAELMAALEVNGATPDFARLARTARMAAAASGNDDDAAATAFIAGYAAGLAEGTGQAGFDRAHRASLRGIEQLVAQAVTGGPVGRAPTT